MARKQIRPIRVEGNIAYVPLTQGYEAVIDAADVPLVDGVNWYAYQNKGLVYARRNAPLGFIGRRTILLHRVILRASDDCLVDHISGDGLDNRRSNLRTATPAENAVNRKAHKNNASGLKGVYLHKRDQKFYAHIAVNGKSRHLGSFSSKEAAADAYAKASAELHGEFGRVR